MKEPLLVSIFALVSLAYMFADKYFAWGRYDDKKQKLREREKEKGSADEERKCER